ncbi:porin family protein [Aureivirga marina]|uniref:porin family protein n=1 Tax=Aureivirga marina TaxID=1182451 RepID=UPI0018C9ED5A|nr:porin family protein [Aureivirga marina]
MKKLVTSIACATALFFSVNSNAQEVEFGAKAGMNISSVSGDIKGAKSKIGFYIGGLAEIGLTDNFSVQPELAYSSQGYKAEVSNTSFTGTEEIPVNLSYLNLDILAKYYFIEDAFSIEAGPQIGYLLGASRDGESEIEIFNTTYKVKDQFKSINFGFNVGANYELENGLGFNARYTVGFSNIVDSEDADDDFKINTGNLSVGLFYKFNK